MQNFVHCTVSFRRDRIPDEDWLRQLVRRFGFVITERSYRLDDESQRFEYRTVMWSVDPEGSHLLEQSLLSEPDVVEFRISPSRD